LPISASAGPVSNFLSSLFGSSNDTKSTTVSNVQNMSLLVAVASPISSDQNPLTIENDALVSNVDSSGSLDNQKSSSDQINTYVVREGDTLSQIANMFDVSVNTIKWSNNLTSNNVKPGDTLVILPISGVKYTTTKGDTLASIAKKFNGDIDEIVAYNNLDKSKTLTAGTEIIIPDGEVTVSSSRYSSSSSSSGSALKNYSGYYIRPIVGGRRTQGVHGHNAVDIAAPVGTPIYAMADGEVIISKVGGWNGGYGNYVVIKHSNGTQTLYAHTNQNFVSVGQKVKQGDVISEIGLTGKTTGAHLHFEIRGATNPF